MTDAVPPPPPRRVLRPRRRTVLWAGLAVGVAFAALIASLATLGSASPSGLSATSSPLQGRPAPVLSGRLLGTNRTLSLSRFAGKWVLVNFAASWCVPCREEMPQLLAFDRTAARFDAVLLTVAEQPSDAPNLHRFLDGEHATWPAIDAGTAQVTWGVQGIPTTYIVDPRGIVVDELPAGVNAAAVDHAIAKAPASSGGT